MSATAVLYLCLCLVAVLTYIAWPHAASWQTPIRYVSEAELQAQRDRLAKAASTTIHRTPRAHVQEGNRS